MRAGGPAARRHRFLGSETSIWPRLTASNAVNDHILHVAKIYHAADLRIRVVCCHACSVLCLWLLFMLVPSFVKLVIDLDSIASCFVKVLLFETRLSI